MILREGPNARGSAVRHPLLGILIPTCDSACGRQSAGSQAGARRPPSGTCRYPLSEENMNAKNDTGDCHSRCPETGRMSARLEPQQLAHAIGPRGRVTRKGVSSWE